MIGESQNFQWRYYKIENNKPSCFLMNNEVTSGLGETRGSEKWIKKSKLKMVQCMIFKWFIDLNKF